MQVRVLNASEYLPFCDCRHCSARRRNPYMCFGRPRNSKRTAALRLFVCPNPPSATSAEQRAAGLIFRQGTTDLHFVRCQTWQSNQFRLFMGPKMLALSEFSLVGTAALVVALAAALSWRPLFSRGGP